MLHVDYTAHQIRLVGSGCIPGFERETDHQDGNSLPGVIA